MENFIFKNETVIIFGKDTQKDVGKILKKYTKKILLHYGGGSIKKSGLYDQVIGSLAGNGIDYEELGGVEPNPRLSLVKKGSDICKKKGIDFILAVGGGSVIDSAKAIALSVPYEGQSMWDFLVTDKKPQKALGIGVILTIPAAGSEASDVTVITKDEGMIKRGYHHEMIRPRFAVLNPELTFTLPIPQIAYGASDILSHVMERYFTRTKFVDLTDRLCEATMKTVLENAPLIFEDPEDYNPRAELMWASTIAHNGILDTGRTGDWASHKLAHELSSMYGIAHGATLSVIFPAWIRYVYKEDLDLFYKFAVRVFGVDACFGSREYIIEKGINSLIDFYNSLDLPTSLSALEIGDDRFEEMAEKTQLFGPIGRFKKLDKKDVIKIYEIAR